VTRFALLLPLLLAGCGQNLTMSDQEKYDQYERAALFRNGRVLQAPPAGIVARDAPEGDVLAQRPPMSLALVERGRERFGIFCAPCHGPAGDGTGLVVQRGMPQPPSLHDPRLIAAPDAHFVDVITNGHGAMYAYGDRVPPRDRWAIAAYIRALQRSQAEAPEDLPPEARARLSAEAAR
jgi:mono/diheme cytochrome c family protein